MFRDRRTAIYCSLRRRLLLAVGAITGEKMLINATDTLLINATDKLEIN